MGQRAGLFWGWHRRPRHPDWGKGCLLPLLQAEDIGPDLWAVPEGWAVGVGGRARNFLLELGGKPWQEGSESQRGLWRRQGHRHKQRSNTRVLVPTGSPSHCVTLGKSHSLSLGLSSHWYHLETSGRIQLWTSIILAKRKENKTKHTNPAFFFKVLGTTGMVPMFYD